MKKLITILTLVLLLSNCNSIARLYSKFGEIDKNVNALPNNTIRIYFDRYGIVYPNLFISDESMKNSNGMLEQLYKRETELFDKILKQNSIQKNGNFDEIVEALQRKLIENYANNINIQGANKKIVFIIHGFNKSATKPEDYNSVKENQIFESKITDYVGKDVLFVEVYWDGLTAQNGSNFSLIMGLNSFKIWDNAQAHSNFVGLELRRVLNRVKQDTVYAFSHSLGASVITTALFNAKKFNKDYYTNEDGGKRIDSMYKDLNYETPTKFFKVGLIAPAIPGVNTFKDYSSRNGNQVDNNYYFVFGYNERDKVLKKFIRLSHKLGATTLGHNYRNEVEKTRKQFDRNLSGVVDYSYFTKCDPQKEHGFYEYANHEDKTRELLKLIFGTK